MNENLRDAIATELEIDASELSRDKLLSDIETWDSVMALTLTVIISDEVGVPVTPGEIKNLATYGDIEDLALAKKGL